MAENTMVVRYRGEVKVIYAEEVQPAYQTLDFLVCKYNIFVKLF